MKTTSKLTAVTLAAALLAAVSLVSAHPGGGYGMGHGPGMGPGAGMGPGFGMGGMHGLDSQAVMAARLGDLKATLKITPAQEPAWAKYEAQVRQQVEARQAFHTIMLAQIQD